MSSKVLNVSQIVVNMSQANCDRDGTWLVEFMFPEGEYGKEIGISHETFSIVHNVKLCIDSISVWSGSNKLQVKLNKDNFKDEDIFITAQVYKDKDDQIVASQIILDRHQVIIESV